MLVKASKLFRIRLDGTFMVGDRLKDLQAAQRAGCQGVFLERGFLESKELSEISSIPAIKRYPTLLEAVSELFG
jgi:phosphoglycolate phosphatase-like HAD superfamily hydrolase